MTKEKFNKEVKNIFDKYNVVDNNVDTPFGSLYIRAEKTNNQKLYSVYMRFEKDFDIQLFYNWFNKDINPYSKKWNIHNIDAEYVLNELDERLDNLQYLLSKYGKVPYTEPKMIF